MISFHGQLFGWLNPLLYFIGATFLIPAPSERIVPIPSQKEKTN